MNDRGQAVFGTQWNIGWLKKTLKQKNRLTHTGIAQCNSLPDIQQGKTISKLGQRRNCSLKAMAISIGFDNRPGFGATGVPFGNQIVMTQCSKVNAGTNRTRHCAKNSKDIW